MLRGNYAFPPCHTTRRGQSFIQGWGFKNIIYIPADSRLAVFSGQLRERSKGVQPITAVTKSENTDLYSPEETIVAGLKEFLELNVKDANRIAKVCYFHT